jgi:predicted PurR-regulated permease PerM
MPRRRRSRSIHGLPPEVVFGAAFLAFTVVLLVLIAKLLAPFVMPLLWAAVLTIVVYPFYRWLVRRLSAPPTVAATITTVLLALAFIGPATVLIVVLAQESRDAYDSLRQTMQNGGGEAIVDRAVRWASSLLPGFLDDAAVRAVEDWLREAWASAVGAISVTLIRGLNRVLADASAFFIKGFVSLIAVFYFLREGEVWLKKLRGTVPLSPRVWDIVVIRFEETLRGVVHGMLLSAAILASLLAIGYKVAGVPVPAVLGMFSFFVAPIPFVGVLVIWVPAVLWLLVSGATMAALGLFIYGSIVIVLVDNLLRPTIMGSIARLPVLFMLLSILGGLVAYGPLGLFLGPVLLAIGMAVGGVFREIAGRR